MAVELGVYKDPKYCSRLRRDATLSSNTKKKNHTTIRDPLDHKRNRTSDLPAHKPTQICSMFTGCSAIELCGRP